MTCRSLINDAGAPSGAGNEDESSDDDGREKQDAALKLEADPNDCVVARVSRDVGRAFEASVNATESKASVLDPSLGRLPQNSNDMTD